LPQSKSAQKQMRVTEKRRLRNRSVQSQTKTNITKAERLIFSGELETAREAVLVAISSLDKAAEKGIIHPNNAARRKSRLMQKLNQAQASASMEPVPEESEETEQTEQNK
jgi:small subunit ribosomal protein S20